MPLLDHYREQADKLVWAAGANACLAYKPILDENPHITSSVRKNGTFFLTVAGVYAAIIQLVHERIRSKKRKRKRSWTSSGSPWTRNTPDGTAALEECRTMVDYSFAEGPGRTGGGGRIRAVRPYRRVDPVQAQRTPRRSRKGAG